MAISTSGNTVGALHPSNFSFPETDWSQIVRTRWSDKTPALSMCDVIGGTPLADSSHSWLISPSSDFYTYLSSQAASGQKDLVVNDASLFHVDQTVVAKGDTDDEDENGIVASISGNTITLVSNLSNTHSAGDAVINVSKAQIYGKDPSETPQEEGTQATNYIQEYNQRITMARVSRALRQEYGMSNEEYTLMQALNRAAIEMDRSVLFDEASAPSSASVRGVSGGIKWAIDTYGTSGVNSVTTSTLKYSTLSDKIQAVQAKGGFQTDSICLGNSKFAAYLTQMAMLNNDGFNIWRDGNLFQWFAVNGVKFLFRQDENISKFALQGTSRTATAMAFFLSPRDVMGNKNFRLFFVDPDGAGPKDYMIVRDVSDYTAATKYDLWTAYCMETGEPDTHMYWQGITSVAAD